MLYESTSLVLVNADTSYNEYRIDHYARIALFQRPQHVVAARPLAYVVPPRPLPTLFEDRFVGVYPVIEYFATAAVPRPQQPFAITLRPSTRLDDPLSEEQFRRVDHGMLFRFIEGIASPAFGIFETEAPNLCDDPWKEWVHPAPTPETQLYPFRQIYVGPGPRHTFALLWYQSPNWKLEAEPDSRPPNLAAQFYPFLQQYAPQVVTLQRVQAVAAGFYNGDYRDIGDVFDVNVLFLSSVGVSFVPPGNPDYPLYGWMQTVPNTTPLFSWALANGGASSPRNSPRRTIV